jgi:hypothetical protein
MSGLWSRIIKFYRYEIFKRFTHINYRHNVSKHDIKNINKMTALTVKIFFDYKNEQITMERAKKSQRQKNIILKK